MQGCILLNSPQYSHIAFHLLLLCWFLRKTPCFWLLGYMLAQASVPLRSSKSLNHKIITFSDHIEFPISVGQACQTACWSCVVKFCPIVELDCKNTFITPSPTIYGQVHLGLDTPWNCITSPFHEKCCNGRVVGNLFEIYRTAVDPALESLSQNWIEWLFHSHINEWASYCRAHNIFHLDLRFLNRSGLF